MCTRTASRSLFLFLLLLLGDHIVECQTKSEVINLAALKGNIGQSVQTRATQFQQETGVQVNVFQIPSLTNLLSEVLADLQQGSPQFDAFVMGAGYLPDLVQYVLSSTLLPPTSTL